RHARAKPTAVRHGSCFWGPWLASEECELMLAQRFGGGRSEEGADVSFVHEVGTDEPGEGEWAGHGVLGGLGQSQDQEGDEGDGDLNANGILGGSEEAGDLEGLLDPAEEQLDRPSQFVEIGDLLSWRDE